MKRITFLSKYIVPAICAVCLLTGCDSANKDYEQGVKYMETGEYKSASSSFKKAVEKNGEKAEYNISYGMALLYTEDYKEAAKQFTHALSKKDNKIVRENNKLAYRGLGIANYNKGGYDTAVEYFGKALEINECNEWNAELYQYILAVQKLQGDYESAIKTCDLRIAEEDGVAEYYLERAKLLQEMGNYDKAVKDYKKALEIDETMHSSYLGMYTCYVNLEKEDKAKEALENITQHKAKSGKEYCYKGQAYAALENWDKAQEAYKSAIKEEYDEAQFYLGELYKEKKAYADAIDSYTKYVDNKESVQAGKAYNQLALCYVETGDIKTALEMIECGLEKKEADSLKSLMKNKVILLEKEGNFKEARTVAKKYIKQFPADSEMEKELDFIKTRIIKDVVESTDAPEKTEEVKDADDTESAE